MQNYTEFEKKIGYSFNDKKLLLCALTHTSYANEHGADSFERLEFLGDSILGFIVAENLFDLHQEKDEGFLSKMRAAIVCENSLSDIARELEIPTYIRLGVGEEKNCGREKNSIISDVVEALIAAIYKDGGFVQAEKFVNRIISKQKYTDGVVKDFKTQLQETYKHVAISYISTPCLNNNIEMFKSTVLLDGIVCGSGVGVSKKSAEQNAAKQALENKQR